MAPGTMSGSRDAKSQAGMLYGDWPSSICHSTCGHYIVFAVQHEATGVVRFAKQSLLGRSTSA